MVVVMMMAADRLGQILHVGELTVLGSVRKIAGKLVELSRRRGIAGRGGGLRRGLQVGSDLRSNLLVLGWIRLLKLLEFAHQLREGRKPGVVRRLRDRRGRAGAQTAVGRVSRQAGALKGTGENRL